MCRPTPLPSKSTRTEDERAELRSLLEALNKGKFHDKLIENDITSVEALASASLETLAEKLPKMVARSLHTTLSKSYEIYVVLKSKGKTEYFAALVAGKICTLEELCDKSVEDLPMPKMTARVIQRKANEAMELRPLREFLIGINKERCFDKLLEINIKTPEDIRDSSMDVLSKAVGRMVSQLLIKRACEHCKPDCPDYKSKLSDETKDAIRSIWKSLKGHSQSFGAKYYELLVAMDQRVVPCFAGVSFPTLGREFDHLLDRFIDNLDFPEKFDELSDGLVARLMRYGIPCRTLWLGDKAFSLAAIAVAPELDVTQNMGVWEEFYLAMIPPLHPTLLKAADLPSGTEWQQLKEDFVQKVTERYARDGYLYLTLWLTSNEHAGFGDDLGNVIQSFIAWQEGKGSWTGFKDCSRTLLNKMNEEMALEFCVLTSKIVADRYGCNAGRSIGNLLMVVACTSYGARKLSNSFRAIQLDTVTNQWGEIYQYTCEDFAELFYQQFTKDRLIRSTFQRTTNWSMQRQRFVHQLNAVIIRIAGGNDVDVRDLLIQLGARHRVHYNLGRREMEAFVEPFMSTLREMIGRTQWRDDTSDSWTYVTTIVLNYMMVGWTCGISILDGKVEQPELPVDGVFNGRALRELRDGHTKEYQEFFGIFAKEISAEGNGRAPTRYLGAVNRILDEPDASLQRDMIAAMGRRHSKYHGVTVEAIAPLGKTWMSSGKAAFGTHFTEKIAIEWAHLWELIAVGMSSEYMASKMTPSLEELMKPYRTTPPPKSPRKLAPTEPIVLTLKEKVNHQHNTCILRFKASAPVEMRAGHFIKLRTNLPSGKTLSRFYSVASCPCPITGTTEDLEFLMKEVKGGKVSPHFVNETGIAVNDRCELLTVAGSFVLPQPVDGTRRLMISAGVGIVAFMSAIRSMVAHVDKGLIKRKVTLALIHSERYPTFPFLDELLAISKRFSNHELFEFNLTLCFTGKETNTEALQQLGESSVKCGRVDRELMSEIRRTFLDPEDLPIYACGPRGFQKAVRETFLKEMGHKRSLIHLEFFDL